MCLIFITNDRQPLNHVAMPKSNALIDVKRGHREVFQDPLSKLRIVIEVANLLGIGFHEDLVSHLEDSYWPA